MFKLKQFLFSLSFAICLLVFLPFLFAADETLTVTTYYPSPYGSYNELTTAGNTYLATTSGTKVGIGTTSPGSKLQLNIPASADATPANYAKALSFRFAGNPAYGWDWDMENYATGDLILQRVLNSALTPVVAFQRATGNVGIGTTSPGYKLSINNGGGTGSGVNNVLQISGGVLTSIDDATGLLFVQRGAADDYGAFIRLVNTGASPGWLNPRLDIGVQNTSTNTQANIGTKVTILGSGNVGIGMAGPAQLLHLYKATGPTIIRLQAGNYGTYWDINQDSAGLGFNYNGTGEIIKMGTNGNVGIGTTSPGAKLSFGDLNDGRNTADGITWYNTGPTIYGIYRTAGAWSAPNYQQMKLSWDTGIIIDGGTLYGKSGTVLQPNGGNVGIGTTPGYKFQVYIDASYEGHVTSTGTWASSSDIRFKKNVSDLKGGLDKILKLRPVRYDSKTEPNSKGQGRHLGFIAQEFEKAVPELVSTDNRGYKAIAYGDLTIVLTKAVQEQQKQIEDLKSEIQKLKKP